MIKNLFITLVLFPMFVYGQEWAPVGAKWIYDHQSGLQPYLTIIESVKDTLILNKSCRKLITRQVDEIMQQDGTCRWDTFTISNDYIYTSNDTVFHYNKFESSFYPLYQLNIEAHDTVLIRDKITPCTQNEYFCSRFEYLVDSISSLKLQENTLKVVYNSPTPSSEWMFNRSWNLENYPVVDKIGSLKYFFGVRKNFVMEGEIACLRCYNDKNISYKSEKWTEDCDHLRPLHGPSSVLLNEQDEFRVFPNPFDSYINISGKYTANYELYNSDGRLLIKGSGHEINTVKLGHGVYFLQLTSGKNISHSIKVIKSFP